MANERYSSIIFEQQGENPILVAKITDLSAILNDPQIANFVSNHLHEDGENLVEWLSPDRWDNVEQRPLYNSQGQQIEYSKIEVLRLPNGQEVEISQNDLLEPAINPDFPTSIHLDGYEAIYVTEGSVTMRVWEDVEPVGTAQYVARGNYHDIELTKGTLALIPSPTANGWVKLGPSGCTFGYVCFPTWNEEIIKFVHEV